MRHNRCEYLGCEGHLVQFKKGKELKTTLYIQGRKATEIEQKITNGVEASFDELRYYTSKNRTKRLYKKIKGQNPEGIFTITNKNQPIKAEQALRQKTIWKL